MVTNDSSLPAQVSEKQTKFYQNVTARLIFRGSRVFDSVISRKYQDSSIDFMCQGEQSIDCDVAVFEGLSPRPWFVAIRSLRYSAIASTSGIIWLELPMKILAICLLLMNAIVGMWGQCLTALITLFSRSEPPALTKPTVVLS